MSMSQEEIEALMNGLDIEDDSDSEDASESVKVNTQEIEELLSQTEEFKEDSSKKIKKEEVVISEEVIKPKSNSSSVDSTDIEKLLSEIESVNEKNTLEKSLEPIVDEPMLDLSSAVKSEKMQLLNEQKSNRSEDEIVKDWTSTKINEGVFPLPAEKDTKVVNQLSQVANDSEEKVSQIFDVLSLTLDNNNEIRNQIKDFESFINMQSNLLNSLNSKFPNIKIFDEHLISANKMSDSLKKLKGILNSEDLEIFQAMELMQFNDINRQKIERVMSVIRKLSMYLNNLFEDDGATKEVAIARHIHGDDTNDLIGDDLDKLIAEFSNNK
ncbi:hypothetical protein AVENP_2579 [Arcobacter venerupis]|uniref:Chemotaxis protein n=2 Tax=Arcobacter venerupis TaxID=1054033 RepID=A0AAE7BD46_9BACT|nr:hypothetical protein AVENP_2579 [Arcobacter venerupis]RWS48829.1 hypothetical protein CKA56_11880 [Arcobacter venerupis]